MAVTTLLLILFSVTALLQTAQAAEFSLTVNIAGDLSVCPTVLGDASPLTEKDIAVTLQNLGPQTDTLLLSLEFPSRQWSGFIESDAVLASGEQTATPLSLFITIPDVAPGLYPVTIRAESAITGDVETAEVDIDVLRCHDVEVSLVQTYQEICAEDNGEVVYEVDVTNFGKEQEQFGLSAIQSGSAVFWATFSDASLTLDPEETATVEVTFSPPAGLTGIQEIAIRASSQNSFASDEKALTLNLLDCFSFAAQLSPDSATVCVGRDVEYTLTITNTGLEPDNYFIEVPDMVTPGDAEIGLDPGEEETVSLLVAPAQIGRVDFSTTVLSLFEPGLEKTVSSVVEGEECRGVAVILSHVEGSVCAGPAVETTVLIKNTGTLEDTFSLSSAIGQIAEEEITLQPSETIELPAIIGTAGLEGSQQVDVSAVSIHSSRVSDRDSFDIGIRNCYSATAELTPPSQEICLRDKPSYAVGVINTGEFADDYTLKLGDQTTEFSLAPGEEEVVPFAATQPYAEPGTYAVLGSLASANGIEEAITGDVVVKEYTACYLLEISPATETEEISAGDAVTLTVSNRGDADDRYDIRVDGPEWLYFSPENLRISAHQDDQLFLYFSPPVGVEQGAYEGEVTVQSATSSAALGLMIDVLPDSAMAIAFTGADGSLVIGADGGQDGIGDLTGFLISGESIDAGKTIALSLIVVIILIILVIRFILFFRD